jgi:hypothetical protein
MSVAGPRPGLGGFIGPGSLRALFPRLASLRISVACLALLLILTAWGTLYQAEHGLYAAQTRFFHSWFFLIGGIVPFPGAQTAIAALFVNLLASMIFRVKYSFANLGNVVTHAGILFLLAGSFLTYHYAQESYLPLMEKEVSNVSLDRRNWELAVWQDAAGGAEKKVTAVEMGPGQAGRDLDFSEFGIQAAVASFYRNCRLETAASGEGALAGRARLSPRSPADDPEDNIAGAVLRLKEAGGATREILLYGGQDEPAQAAGSRGAVRIALRQQRHPLPMTIRLLDVRKKEYPGTGIARSFESDVEVESDGVAFKSRIYMNHPLHYQGYVFYQSSYAAGAQGRETSVFAVVENRGRLVPYISGGLVFAGMVLHFLMRLFGYGQRPGRNGTLSLNGRPASRRPANPKAEALK